MKTHQRARMHGTNAHLEWLIGALLVLLSGYTNHVYATNSSAELHLTLRYVDNASEPYLFAHAVLKGLDADCQVLIIPDRWANARSLHRSLLNLRGEAGSMIEVASETEARVCGKERTVTYSWDIQPRKTTAPSSRDMTRYRPLIQPDYVHLIGHTFLILPDQPEAWRTAIRFEQFPVPWSMQTTLGELKDGTFRSLDTPITPKRAAFWFGKPVQQRAPLRSGYDVVLAGSALELKVLDVQRIASLLDQLDASTGKARQSDYQINLMVMQGAPQDYALDGTAFVGGFSVFMTGNVEVSAVERLLFHEILHEWLSLAFPPLQEPEAEMYWFSEGAMDYFTDRLLMDWGFIDRATYLQRLDLRLRDISLSPWAHLGHKELAERFFESHALSQLTYARGAALAMFWDRRLGKVRGDATERIYDGALRELGNTWSGQTSSERIFATMKEAGITSPTVDWKRIVDQGDLSDLIGLHIDACTRLEAADIFPFEIGFDFEASGESRIISGVSSESNAWQAGLRNSQRYHMGRWQFGNPDAPAELTITDPDSGEKTITFLPRATRAVASLKAKPIAGCEL